MRKKRIPIFPNLLLIESNMFFSFTERIYPVRYCFFIRRNLPVQNIIRKIYRFKTVRFPFLKRPASVARVENAVKLLCTYDWRGDDLGEIAIAFRRFGPRYKGIK